MKQRSIAFALNAVILANFVTGCGRPDLSGYRLAKEHANDSKEPETSVVSTVDPETAKTDAEDLSPQALDADSLPASALMPVNVVSDVRGLMSLSANYAGSKDVASAQLPDATASTTDAATADPAATKPSQIELLIKEKTFKAEPKTGALRVSFDDLDLLKVLNMEPVVPNAEELMPDWLKGLEGKRVRLRGYMFPTFEAEGIERFVLARDSQLCCFGPNAKVYDLIQVDLKQGQTTNYIPPTRAFDVVGTFHIKLLQDDGKPYGLYMIDQANLIDR